MKVSRLLIASLLLLCLTAGMSSIHAREMMILNSELWHTMTYGEKTAFVWGAGHVATFEYRAMEEDGQGANDSLIPPLVETLQQYSINEVVTAIDGYYQAHPDQAQRPVLDVIFQTLVFPAMAQ